jgi:tRNA(Ile)-lysidine synthetase-like protein
VLVRDRIRAYDPAVAALVVRALLAREGVRLDRIGTRLVLEFITGAASGREIPLPGGSRMSTEFDLARVETGPRPAPSAAGTSPLRLEGDRGSGSLVLAGRRWTARWRTGDAGEPRGERSRLSVAASRAPLVLREARPGDRLRTRVGRRSLKKILGEARVPARLRRTLPVLVDGTGAALWVPGLAVAVDAHATPGEPAIILSLDDAEH